MRQRPMPRNCLLTVCTTSTSVGRSCDMGRCYLVSRIVQHEPLVRRKCQAASMLPDCREAQSACRELCSSQLQSHVVRHLVGGGKDGSAGTLSCREHPRLEQWHASEHLRGPTQFVKAAPTTPRRCPTTSPCPHCQTRMTARRIAAACTWQRASRARFYVTTSASHERA